MQQIVDHIIAYYDSPLLIGSDEIIKRLQMCLSSPQIIHKCLENISGFFLKTYEQSYFIKQPAVQAAGADPSRCKSTNRQNLPLH